eukprot:15439058-Alexandrium_andersonii.AAC.1
MLRWATIRPRDQDTLPRASTTPGPLKEGTLRGPGKSSADAATCTGLDDDLADQQPPSSGPMGPPQASKESE